MLGFMGGLHYWWPKMTGRLYPEAWARVSAVILFVGFNLTFFPNFSWDSRACPGATMFIRRSFRC